MKMSKRFLLIQNVEVALMQSGIPLRPLLYGHRPTGYQRRLYASGSNDDAQFIVTIVDSGLIEPGRGSTQ